MKVAPGAPAPSITHPLQEEDTTPSQLILEIQGSTQTQQVGTMDIAHLPDRSHLLRIQQAAIQLLPMVAAAIRAAVTQAEVAAPVVQAAAAVAEEDNSQ